MKTKLTRNLTSLALALAFIQFAGPARADGTATKEHTCRGRIAAVDVKERTLKLHSWLGPLASWKFNLASDATVAVAMGKDSTLGDLKRGMEVAVVYRSTDGVRVASSVTQRSHDYSGVVQKIEPATREVTIERGRITRKFWLPDSARIAIHDKTVALDDLKCGQRVSVHFVWRGDTPAAYLVEDTTASFSGSVAAIDATSGTLRVKHLLGEKKFQLGDGCRIVTADANNARLADLRIGQGVTVHYHDMSGVLVASWLTVNDSSTADHLSVK